jgi:hypothetical protein
MKTHFLQQPAAEILQSENVTTPATHKTAEDERRQNCQTKKDEPGVHEPVLQRVHGFRWLDGRNRSTREPPLDDVRDHEQVEKDQCRPAPAAGLRFTYACSAEPGDAGLGTSSRLNRSSGFQFWADATTFNRVGEFTSKRAVRHRPDEVWMPGPANSKIIASNFGRFSLRFQSTHDKHYYFTLRAFLIHE